MKNILIKGLAFVAITSSIVACSDNAWNDKLDGFIGDEPITDVKTIEYTLTDADYAAIAANATNKALAGDANADALKAVGTKFYFNDAITAAEYVPAFLSSTSFPYFTLSNGSAVKVTYRLAEALPKEIVSLESAEKYTLSSDDYQLVWGSDDNFVNCLAPSKQASKVIPMLLSDNFDDAEAGTYVIVTYQVSEQEPVFGSIGEPEGPTYTHIKSNSIVSGYPYVLVANGNAGEAQPENKGYGYLYKIEVEVVDNGNGIILPEGENDCEFRFIETTGGYYMKDCYDRYVWMDDSHNSFQFSAELPEEIAAAVWTVEAQADGAMKITNSARQKYIQYSEQYNSYGSYPNEQGILPTLYVNQSINGAKAVTKAPAADVPYVTAISVWNFNGSSWTSPSDVVILQPSDYTNMGQTYQNLSNDAPARLLPIYLSKKFPYAAEDDSKYIMYQYYSGGTTKYVCDQYVFNGTEWAKNNGVVTEVSQFVRNEGKWNFDPSVTLTLPAGKGQPLSTLYYQACVDWVYENIDVPLGSTSIKSGMYYVTSYGNNEYYSGTSAYQGNVDLRASAAIQQYPDGYKDMSNDEIVELMKHRFAFEVFPGALKAIHPDAVPVAGIDVMYTFTFGTYTGSNSTYTIVYKVTGPAEFEFVSCDWWEGGKPAE